ncbi:MAG: tetratricopeptide repeat protein [Flavobacteriales bacterium]|nr:tetratricopeptide repeat protein [Flavobacteriales bacterium]
MKTRFLSLFFLLAASFAVAQKDEIKNLQKSIKGGNPQEIENAIASAEASVANATDDFKAQFYFHKLEAKMALVNKNINKNNNLLDASNALETLENTEKAMGKMKYVTQAKPMKEQLKGELVNGAIADQNAKNYKDAEMKIYKAYLMSPQDTSYLYYAAQFAIGDNNMNKALDHFIQLKKMKFSDVRKTYFATNKETGKEESFDNEAMRNISIQTKTHEKPRNGKSDSKRGEIVRNIALIYLQNKELDKAKEAFKEAKQANPNDTSLLITEANMYLELKDYATYKSIISSILANNPNDADLFYNLGVISANSGELEEAEKHYMKAIEINPKYANAYLNLAVAKLDGEAKIVEQMNSLGNSAADNKKYEELKKVREGIYKAAMPYLEKYVELDGENQDAIKTLMGVYTALDMTDKYKEAKAKLKN